eukprot:TRINITY_DN10636_c0_g1_i1.p1 TRINITY_DN10636_c0_g1~~TRINITY_DN10636_c0_g1_i1.p1  ORF type:complete len:584 (-),score=132.91 TRINITY_DN10636_c0_g1_i1:1546-3159(-)
MSDENFFRVKCKDNGTGMKHDDIPNMLGVGESFALSDVLTLAAVLSSTKYDLKQTRGKFGLGAKMALVWSKKSTGLPIQVYSSSNSNGQISFYKLDIDVHRNRPEIITVKKLDNPNRWRGTEISVVIKGKWSSYRHKILSYLRQLAIITPYANFLLRFTDRSDLKKSFSVQFVRRTDQMPEEPKVVKYHPSSVDNLLVETLLRETKQKNLSSFLHREFSCVPLATAKEIEGKIGKDLSPSSLNRATIHKLTQLLHHSEFPKPDASCLSPAGEYNLRLGIFKEVAPDLVATASAKPAVYEGHPFLVEAGVSIGGRDAKQGVTVYRFANRIPLIFEPSSDVISKVALTKIKWVSYKIRPKIDKIGVFVSIVSTKIPFKGTSKEYIGDDKEGGALHETIKAAIQQCCKQLRTKLAQQAVDKEQEERRKNMSKYIPDVSRALEGALSMIAERRRQARIASSAEHSELLRRVHKGEVNSKVISKCLETHVEKVDAEAAIEFVSSQGHKNTNQENFFIVPLRSPQSKLILQSDSLGIRVVLDV